MSGSQSTKRNCVACLGVARIFAAGCTHKCGVILQLVVLNGIGSGRGAKLLLHKIISVLSSGMVYSSAMSMQNACKQRNIKLANWANWIGVLALEVNLHPWTLFGYALRYFVHVFLVLKQIPLWTDLDLQSTAVSCRRLGTWTTSDSRGWWLVKRTSLVKYMYDPRQSSTAPGQL